jgi:hypothetical protein
MASINIVTDGTVKNTKLTVDGKDVTKKEKVVSIDMYAYAPYKSSYSGESIPGSVSVSYSVAQDDGTIMRKAIHSGNDRSDTGIGQKIKSKDMVIRFMGEEADVEVSDLVDKIVAHCEEKKISCPDREILLARSLDSLKDKAEDLGIDLDDQEDQK